MRRRLGPLLRAPAATMGERLLILAVRELGDEDRPVTRRAAERFIGRLFDLCELLARIDRAAGADVAVRREAAMRVDDARWSLGFLRGCGALTPDVQRRISAGLDVVRRRIGVPAIPLSASTDGRGADR